MVQSTSRTSTTLSDMLCRFSTAAKPGRCYAPKSFSMSIRIEKAIIKMKNSPSGFWGLCVGGLGVWLAVVGCGCALLCWVPGGGFPDMEGFSVIVVFLCLVYAFYVKVSLCPLFTQLSEGCVV